MLWFVLTGCGGLTYWGDDLARLGLETTDTGATSPVTDGEGGSVVIASLAPDFGSNAGGTEVVITGEFTGQPTVRFGGVEADVVDRSATAITVIAPPTSDQGWVDVTVQAGGASDAIDPGFQYFEDATGEAGVFGYVEYVHMVGGYWSDPSDYAYADLGFMEPGDWDMRAVYSPALNQCVAWDFAIVPPPLIDTGASQWDLVASGATVPLAADDTVGGLFTNPDAVADIVPGQTYDLEGSPASGDWPVYDLPDAVAIPGAFTVTSPSLAGANEPLVTRSGFTLTWTGGGGDYMVIWLMRRQGAGSFTTVSCSAADDGSFTIPFDVWPDWYAGEFIDVQVGRVLEANTKLPHDNSENRVAGSYWYYGAVITD